MALSDVTDWIDEHSRPGATWFAKRLAANDTLATNAHQAGPYIPKEFLFQVLPALHQPDQLNPDYRFDMYVDSHADHRNIRAVWYNNSVCGNGTRNEARLTGFGGIGSALLDPDSTGALAVFVFVTGEGGAPVCHVWVCDSGTEADLFEERIGTVEPKQYIVWQPGSPVPQGELFDRRARNDCRLTQDEIPADWLQRFPSGVEIVRKSMELRPPAGMNADVRLLRRRACEFEIFRSVEDAFWLPKVGGGFESLEAFVSLAQSILQSRKSRSGKSLEYHACEIFEEEGLASNQDYAHNPTIEGNRKPDFLFPNTFAYTDDTFPSARLRMLAAKTTCKDRWRQILNEADRIPVKHLLTLQEGVSENQFNEMTDAGVRLVVPAGLHRSYPETVRPHLATLEEFIGEVRLLQPARP